MSTRQDVKFAAPLGFIIWQILTDRQIAGYNGRMDFDAKEPIAIGGKVFTRGEISRGTGLSISHVSRIFGGKRQPSLATIRRIATWAEVEIGAVILAIDHYI